MVAAILSMFSFFRRSFFLLPAIIIDSKAILEVKASLSL